MQLSKEIEKQARSDIFNSLSELVDRYIEEGLDLYDLKRYFKINKSFNLLLEDINYVGRKHFEDGDEYRKFVKKVLDDVLLDRKSNIDTLELSENRIIKFNEYLNESEKSWEIKEVFPIKVDVKKSWTGKYYNINVPPMKMKYETWQMLGDNLSSEQIKYGKEKDDREYKKEIELYPNDVSMSHYDYKTGESSFSASTKNDVRNWLNLYKDYVYVDNYFEEDGTTSGYLNESIIPNEDLTVEYLFNDIEHSKEDKDILSKYFNTKEEYIESVDPGFCVYEVTDFQTDVLKNNRTRFNVLILADYQISKMMESLIKKIVSGVLSEIPEEIDYMGIRVKPSTIMDKTKLKESVGKLINEQEVLDILTNLTKYIFVEKYGNYYIWKKEK